MSIDPIKEPVIAPDFSRRFADPPGGPHVGDQLVELLLDERKES
jgi:hypothetical protein